MDIQYLGNSAHLPALYEAMDDIPGLFLAIHLHAWHYPEGVGQVKLRVEIHQGQPQPGESLVGVGYVSSGEEHVHHWTGTSPLAQALLDGLFTHEEIHAIMTRAAKQALNADKPETEEKKRKIPLKFIRQFKDKLY
ncbi:MAG: hypothetical protein G8345_09415 [Magnetococcales bacterium]|nr:hypothetical protein [Magnetococcales bacterium]NGZ27093.1 hypothetical protein [Magnetococcales bacterium]